MVGSSPDPAQAEPALWQVFPLLPLYQGRGAARDAKDVTTGMLGLLLLLWPVP